MFCLIFAIVYGQVEHGEGDAASDLEGAESANPQWGYGGYGRGTIHTFFISQKKNFFS